jgi:hypothetical protein
MSKLMIKNARLSFPSLFEHATFQGESLNKYECTLLIPKDSDAAKEVQSAIKKAGMEALGADWSKAKLCILDGDTKEYDGYEGTWAVKASTKKRPVIINKDKSAVSEEDGVIYAGCYVNASVSISAFQSKYGKFVQAQLNALQFYRDGEQFGGGGDGFSIDEFDSIDSDDGDDGDTIPF